jgi:hypothetical protein
MEKGVVAERMSESSSSRGRSTSYLSRIYDVIIGKTNRLR